VVVRLAAALGLTLLWCAPALADEALGADAEAAIHQVIAGQLDALSHEDGAGAFRFASPGIQARFGDAPHFLDMVRQAYPVIMSPHSVNFAGLASADGHVVQKVELIGRSGISAVALYEMEHEPDGSWKIAGCTLIESDHLDI
jgi:hypothetical protein